MIVNAFAIGFVFGGVVGGFIGWTLGYRRASARNAEFRQWRHDMIALAMEENRLLREQLDTEGEAWKRA